MAGGLLHERATAVTQDSWTPIPAPILLNEELLAAVTLFEHAQPPELPASRTGCEQVMDGVEHLFAGRRVADRVPRSRVLDDVRVGRLRERRRDSSGQWLPHI
jgi:hypothetical protein